MFLLDLSQSRGSGLPLEFYILSLREFYILSLRASPCKPVSSVYWQHLELHSKVDNKEYMGCTCYISAGECAEVAHAVMSVQAIVVSVQLHDLYTVLQQLQSQPLAANNVMDQMVKARADDSSDSNDFGDEDDAVESMVANAFAHADYRVLQVSLLSVKTRKHSYIYGTSF